MAALSSPPSASADSKASKPGSTIASAQSAVLEELSQSECILRLEANGIGRVAAVLDCRPYICPVNYVIHEGAIVFRTRRGSHLHMATNDSYAALEIDSADFMNHEGWTVLVQGRSSHVSDPVEAIALAQVCAAPWAGEARDSFVRILVDEVRGETISHRSPCLTARFTVNDADFGGVQSLLSEG